MGALLDFLEKPEKVSDTDKAEKARPALLPLLLLCTAPLMTEGWPSMCHPLCRLPACPLTTQCIACSKRAEQSHSARAQACSAETHLGSHQVAKAKEKKAKAKEKAEKTTETKLATKTKTPRSSAKKPASKAAAEKEEAPKSSAKRKVAPKEAPRKVTIRAKLLWNNVHEQSTNVLPDGAGNSSYCTQHGPASLYIKQS